MKMKRILSFLLILGLAVGFLIGCGTNDSAPDQEPADNDEATEVVDETDTAPFPLEVEDAAGNEITIENEPERIVSLIPGNTEILFALELGDKVVGVTENDTYPEEVLDIDKVGDYDINVEQVMSLDPDLVLAHASSAESSHDVFEQLENADIPVYVVRDAQSIEETYASIEDIGQATGASDQAEQLITDMQEGFAAIEEKVEQIQEEDRKSVFIEISPEPEIFTGGKGTFFNELIGLVQADNAAGDQEGWVQLDPEAIVELNPDVILTTYGSFVENPEEQVLSREGFGDVTAIKEEQVFDVDEDIVSRPGPRLVDGTKEIAKVVYPELFEE